jgi:dnd system-associated protein 4
VTVTDRRIRRPKEREVLLQKLVTEGPFAQLRDVLVFAAALGYAEKRRLAFTNAGEPIRWDVATNRRGTEALVNMIATAESNLGPEALAEEHFAERLSIFEEYANGGLQFLQERLNAEKGTPEEIVLRLVERALRTDDPQAPPDLEKLADELTW